MRKLLATVTLLLVGLFGLPGTAHAAAPRPLGGGAVLFDPFGTARCTAAFAAVSGPDWYLITGRGCSTWTQLHSGAMTPVGTVVAATPAYALVRVTNTSDWDLVPTVDFGAGQFTVRGSAEAPLGGSVCLADVAVGVRCGTVVGKGETINFPGGAVHGLTRTTVCPTPEPIAFVSGDQAQGVPLGGGSGNCTTGGTTWFSPVNPILHAYGLTLLTG